MLVHRRVGKSHVGVRAAKAKRADPGGAQATFPVPCLSFTVGTPMAETAPVDMGVQFLKM